MRRSVAAAGAGLLFGAGLLVSGMTDPNRVRAFLDFTGRWDPSLAGVMVGAILVHGAALFWERRRIATNAATHKRGVDGRMVAGAAVFGVGWGLSGYCPGPALVTLGLAPTHPRGWIFFVSMIVGVAAWTVLSDRARGNPRADHDQAA